MTSFKLFRNLFIYTFFLVNSISVYSEVIGVTDGPQISLKSWEDQLNVNFHAALQFYRVEDPIMGIESIKRNIYSKDVSLVIIFDGYTLQNIIDGDVDKYLIQWGQQLNHISTKKNLYIRPLHEFNGDWYSYGTYLHGNSIKKFKKAYIHIVNTIRKHGGNNVKWQLSYNGKQPGDDQTPFIKYYPGGQYVDMILASSYNRCDNGEKEESFQKIFEKVYKKLQSINSDKPLGIAETATSGKCGSKGIWYQDMFKSLKNNFKDIKMVNIFLEDKKYMDWRITKTDDKYLFSKAYNKYF